MHKGLVPVLKQNKGNQISKIGEATKIKEWLVASGQWLIAIFL